MPNNLYDVRWHNAQSHLVGSWVVEGENAAFALAIGQIRLDGIKTVRILHRSSFIYTFTKDKADA